MNPLSNLQADWPTISRLLDEALALPPAERGAWLAALPAEMAELKDTLARLLASTGGIETGDFLHTLPKLDTAAPGETAAAAQAGSEVGPWWLLRELGEGGMGSVWLAERADGSLKRQVAVKLPRVTWQRGLAERMARERDILATLEHPNIARLYDAGVDLHGRPWLALEYVQGRPIDEHARDKALDMKQRVQLLLQVCEAVAFAHSRLVIHRDLKPGNILVTDDGQVKLLDFGIAKLMQGENAAATALTELSGRALTLDYASPEQVRGQPLTTASDVYSLGVVAYELLSGTRPYKLKRGSAAELEEAIESAEVPAASAAVMDKATRQALKGDLDAILGQALQKEAARRYQSVDALAGDLARHLAGEPVAARPDNPLLRARRLLRRHPLPLSVAGIIALALLGGAHAQAAVMVALGAGALLAAWQRREALQQAELARAEAAEARRQRERAEVVKGFALGLFEGADIELGGTVHTTALDLLKRAEADLAAAPEGDAETALELRVALARSLLGLDQSEAALRVLDAADSAAGLRVAAAHPLRLRLTLVRADALQHLKRHAESSPLLDALLPRLAAQAPLQATALRLRAVARYVLGQYPEALADARQAVARAENGVDRLELLLALNEQTRLLANLFQGERLASAERALAVALQCDPRRHALPILVARELFASANCFEGDARRGLEEFRGILEDLEAKLGPRHSRVAEAHNTRAGAQYQCGDSEGALLSLQRCMAIEEAEHGPDTQNMRQGRAGLGGVLVNEGRYDEGLALLRQACDEFTAHEGPTHPIRGVAISRLIAGLIKAGLLDEAEQRLQEIEGLVLDREAKRDEWNEWQAQLLRSRGRIDEALALLEPMQQRRLASPMLHTRGVASALLGSLRVDAGRHAQALEPLQRALEIFRGRHPFGSAAMSRVQADIGRVLLAQGDATAAVAQMRQALAYWDAHGPEREPASEIAGWLALSLHAAGETADARRLAARALRGSWRTEVHRLAGLRQALVETGLASGLED